MRIGLIGSGRIGGTLAQLAVAAGHEVVLSNSRGPDTFADLVSELGPLARAGTVEEAAATILEGVAAGALSIYVPGYFAEFASQKAQDVDGFLAGTAAYVQSRAATPSEG